MKITSSTFRLAAIAAFCVLPFTAHAAIILDSGSPDFSDNNAVGIGSSVSWMEQFTLGGTETVDSVQLGLSMPTFASPWDGTAQFYLYDDSQGTPSSLVEQGTNPAFNLISLGDLYPDTFYNDYEYQFNLTTPVTLNAGTYWIGTATSSSQYVYWVAANDTAYNAGCECGGFSETQYTLSLDLSNTELVSTSPEPATGGLILLAGIVFGAMRLRKGKAGSPQPAN